MSGLEIVGAAALYVLGLIVLAYASAGVMAFFMRHRDLSGLAPVILIFFGVLIVGAIVGLVLLGRMLA